MFDMLHGLRVLDLGTGVSGPYCAKLFLDAGASVVRVEPPGGDPLRFQGPPVDEGAGAAFAFCNAGKQSVVLDYTQPDGARRLWELLRWADVVIENEAPGVLAGHGFGAEDVLAARPAMVYVSITGYGQTGPRRDWRISELSIGAAGGMVDLNGADDREPIAYPGNVMGIWCGAAAAAGALAAWRHARRTGAGQHVDVSMQEAIASAIFLFYADYEYTGAIQPRGQRELLAASDGDLYLRWVGSPEWDEFAIAMETLELAVRPELGPPEGQALHFDEIMRLLGETVKTKTREHWRGVAMEHGFLAGPLQRPDEFFACPHLAARDFFDALGTASGRDLRLSGLPYTVDRDRPALRRAVPRPGEHTDAVFAALPADRAGAPVAPVPGAAARPALDGVRILDNGVFQAGTFPARILADLGAEVVRVENYLNPDVVRGAPQPDGEAAAGFWERGGIHHEQHRNKRYGVGLDITTADGRDAFLRLAANCDVVLDNHPYDVFERLGLTWEALREANPHLVFVSTSGYGATGPLRRMRALGMVLELATLTWFNGYRGEKPRRGNPPVVDHVVAYHVAFLILAGIERRDRTGAGAWIDVAQYEIGANLAGDLLLSEAAGHPVERGGSDYPGHLLDDCFPGAGPDRWLAVSIPDRPALDRVAALIGPSAAGCSDPDALRRHLAAWSRARDPLDAATQLQAVGVPASPVNNVRDLLLDDHLRERDFFWLIDHDPVQEPVGARAWPGSGVRLTGAPAPPVCRAPMLGEHNRRIATQLMGYTEAEYEALEARGAFGSVPLAADAIPAKQDLASRPDLSAWSVPWKAREMDPHYHERLRERFGRFGAGARRGQPDRSTQ